MSADKITMPLTALATPRVATSTDTTQGTPLVQRASTRRAELRSALARTAATDARGREALAAAIAAGDALLTGDTAKLTDATAADLNRWIETVKHLGVVAPRATPDAR